MTHNMQLRDTKLVRDRQFFYGIPRCVLSSPPSTCSVEQSSVSSELVELMELLFFVYFDVWDGL